jgi:hypothetical protein
MEEEDADERDTSGNKPAAYIEEHIGEFHHDPKTHLLDRESHDEGSKERDGN